MKKLLAVFFFGFTFAILGLRVIDAISNNIQAISEWALSFVNLKTSKNNTKIMRENNAAEMYANELPNVVCQDDDGNDYFI